MHLFLCHSRSERSKKQPTAEPKANLALAAILDRQWSLFEPIAPNHLDSHDGSYKQQSNAQCEQQRSYHR